MRQWKSGLPMIVWQGMYDVPCQWLRKYLSSTMLNVFYIRSTGAVTERNLISIEKDIFSVFEQVDQGTVLNKSFVVGSRIRDKWDSTKTTILYKIIKSSKQLKKLNSQCVKLRTETKEKRNLMFWENSDFEMNWNSECSNCEELSESNVCPEIITSTAEFFYGWHVKT